MLSGDRRSNTFRLDRQRNPCRTFFESNKSGGVLATIKAEREAASPSRRQRILEAIALGALGSIPGVGGVLFAAATFKTGEAGVRQDDLRTQWLQEDQQAYRYARCGDECAKACHSSLDWKWA